MKIEFAIRDATAADRAAISALLGASALPLDGIDDAAFIVAENGDVIIACAALERRGAAALLRSVAVDTAWRGKGVGYALVSKMIAAAAIERIDPIVLLTTTAPEWFARFGFTRVTREEVPDTLLASAEFQGACPSSAVIMQRAATAETPDAR